MTVPGGVGTAEHIAVTQRLTNEQRTLLKRAGEAERRVWKLYPDPVARVLAIEIRAYIEMGHRFEQAGRTNKLIDHILAEPIVRS